MQRQASNGFHTGCQLTKETDWPCMRNNSLFALQAEFEDICEEAELWTKLHDLEQLCQEQGLLDGQDAAVRYFFCIKTDAATTKNVACMHETMRRMHCACMHAM